MGIKIWSLNRIWSFNRISAANRIISNKVKIVCMLNCTSRINVCYLSFFQFKFVCGCAIMSVYCSMEILDYFQIQWQHVSHICILFVLKYLKILLGHLFWGDIYKYRHLTWCKKTSIHLSNFHWVHFAFLISNLNNITEKLVGGRLSSSSSNKDFLPYY